MSLEKAEFKKKKQLPAEEKKFGKKLKKSKKKPWIIISEWKDDAIITFKSVIFKNGKFTEEIVKTKTGKELNNRKEDSIYLYDFINGSKYQSEKAALDSFDNYKSKKELKKQKNYYLINAETKKQKKLK